MKPSFDRVLGSRGSFTRQLSTGSAWAFLARAVSQLAIFLRIIVLARILAPEDFGLIGMVLLVTTALDAFTMPGLNAAAIHRKSGVDDLLQTILTFGIVRGVILAPVIVLLSPAISDVFGEPSLKRILLYASVMPLLKGIENPALVRVQRKVEFRPIFALSVAEAVVSLSSAILLALLWGNATALMLSFLLGQLARVIASYVLVSWKPTRKLSFSGIGELNQFGRWILAANILSFLALQADNAFVGVTLGPTALGIYQIAFRISQLPAEQITHVVASVAFPSFSNIRLQPNELKSAYLRMFSVLLVINGGIALVLVAAAGPLIHILVGPAWEPAVPLVRILAISGFVRSMITSGASLFFGVGLPHLTVAMNAVRVGVFFLIAYPAAKMWSETGIALAVLISVCAAVPLYFAFTRRAAAVLPSEHFSFLARQVRALLAGKVSIATARK